MEIATLEWVDWFNQRRLLEPIGNVPPAEKEFGYYQNLESSHGGLTQTTETPGFPGRFTSRRTLDVTLSAGLTSNATIGAPTIRWSKSSSQPGPNNATWPTARDKRVEVAQGA